MLVGQVRLFLDRTNVYNGKRAQPQQSGYGRDHIAAGLLPAVEAADTKREPEGANASTKSRYVTK